MDLLVTVSTWYEILPNFEEAYPEGYEVDNKMHRFMVERYAIAFEWPKGDSPDRDVMRNLPQDILLDILAAGSLSVSEVKMPGRYHVPETRWMEFDQPALFLVLSFLLIITQQLRICDILKGYVRFFLEQIDFYRLSPASSLFPRLLCETKPCKSDLSSYSTSSSPSSSFSLPFSHLPV